MENWKSDAIQKYLESGKSIRSHVVTGRWLDIGRIDDLLESNTSMLDGYMQPNIKGTTIENSLIRGSVSIGGGVTMINSSIERSLILERSRIEGVYQTWSTASSAERRRSSAFPQAPVSFEGIAER